MFFNYNSNQSLKSTMFCQSLQPSFCNIKYVSSFHFQGMSCVESICSGGNLLFLTYINSKSCLAYNQVNNILQDQRIFTKDTDVCYPDINEPINDMYKCSGISSMAYILYGR